MTEALRELIARVETESTGLVIDGFAAEVFPPESAGGGCTFHLVLKAYRGDLNAAMSLHKSVLPHCGWEVSSPALGAEAAVWSLVDGSSPAIEEMVEDDNAARSWLIAILRRALSEAEG